MSGRVVSLLETDRRPFQRRDECTVKETLVTLPYPYGQLNRLARLYIALRHTMRIEPTETCRLLGITAKQYHKINRLLQEDVEGKSVLAMGLPSLYGDYLPPSKKIYCRQCNNWLNWVPCVQCNCSTAELTTQRKVQEPTPPMPTEPTDFQPGSASKIEVMRRRVEANQQPFHVLDKGSYLI